MKKTCRIGQIQKVGLTVLSFLCKLRQTIFGVYVLHVSQCGVVCTLPGLTTVLAQTTAAVQLLIN